MRERGCPVPLGKRKTGRAAPEVVQTLPRAGSEQQSINASAHGHGRRAATPFTGALLVPPTSVSPSESFRSGLIFR